MIVFNGFSRSVSAAILLCIAAIGSTALAIDYKSISYEWTDADGAVHSATLADKATSP